MVTASTHAIALTGVEGYVIRIDAAITSGPAGLVATGLPDTTAPQTRDRVRAAIINSGHAWPDGQITVTVGPAGMPNRGSSLDLGIAIAVLAAGGSVPTTGLGSIAFIGELGLDGKLRPVPGVLSAAAAAAWAGYATVMAPAGNRAEALLVESIRVIAPDNLAAAVQVLNSAAPLTTASSPAPRPGPAHGGPDQDVSEVAGQPATRWAAEICAAGGHSVLLRGRPPGPATAAVAEQIQAIMPPLATADAIEVTAIHSLAGDLDPRTPLIRVPPVAASLAHRGVLYLENAPEFDRQVLDALRQPVEHGEVTIHRGGIITRFPARFILVLAAGRCPCDAYRLTGAGRSFAPAVRWPGAGTSAG
jgi:magnesium chelatase family protein